MTVHPDDIAGVTTWFDTLAAHVRDVDFVGARPIFAPDMIAFGTFTDFMTGRDVSRTAAMAQCLAAHRRVPLPPGHPRHRLARIGCRQSAWASSIPPAIARTARL